MNAQVQEFLEITKRTQGNNFDSTTKTLKTVLDLIIHRVFLAEFTRTGKSKPEAPRKIAFQSRSDKLHELLVKVVSKFHPQYDKNTMEKHLINKILKNAYE